MWSCAHDMTVDTATRDVMLTTEGGMMAYLIMC